MERWYGQYEEYEEYGQYEWYEEYEQYAEYDQTQPIRAAVLKNTVFSNMLLATRP